MAGLAQEQLFVVSVQSLQVQPAEYELLARDWSIVPVHPASRVEHWID